MRSSKRPPLTAVVLVGHGSGARGFDAPMRRVARALRREKRYREVRCAFLDCAEPSIPKAIADCVSRGAGKVKVLPYFVLSGKHVTRDIPRIVKAAKRSHRRRASVVLCRYLGYHPGIVSAVKQRLHG